MVILYGQCGRNARDAARQYAVRFPAGPHPTTVTIRNVVRRLRETGCFNGRPRSGRPGHFGQHVQPEDVVAYVLDNPRCSTRGVSSACGLSSSRVCDILHQAGAHPYHAIPMQTLLPGDAARRFDWCNFVMNTLHIQPNFLSNILWTDESKFTRCGMFNRHNDHYWGIQNPSWGPAVRHQKRWSVNVWCGIWRNRLVGPVFYEGTLTGRRYLELLESILPDFEDDLPLVDLRSLWFQHDGAPAHRPAAVQRLLTDTFGQRIIGYGGSVEWPPRSPDLTPLDFFLWGYLKDQVYQTEATNPQDLRRRINDACTSVTPEMLLRVQQETLSRIQTCIVADGGHIEHIK